MEIVEPATAVAGAVRAWMDRSGRSSNVAVHVVAAFMVTLPSEQSASPLQPANTEFAAAAVVRVTGVPAVKPAEHAAPQLIPAGALVTVPLPLPDLVMVRVMSASAGSGLL